MFFQTLVWNRFYAWIMFYLGVFICYLPGIWFINLCVCVCVCSLYMCIYMSIYLELGGASRQASSSIRHPGSCWALPPWHLPQRSETGNRQVTPKAWPFHVSRNEYTCWGYQHLLCGFRSMGCLMDSLVFVSSWRSPIVQAKLQVKVKLQQERINLQIMYTGSRHTLLPSSCGILVQ